VHYRIGQMADYTMHPILMDRGSDAVLELLQQVSELPLASLITRLRIEAALYDPPPTREQRQLGRPRLKGDWRPTLEAVLAEEDTMWSQLTIER
jgi:hypothetical protein